MDTNIVIHGRRLDPSALPENGTISTITVAELAAGVTLAKDLAVRAERLGVLQQAEASFDPLPFDDAAAHAYARVVAAVVAAGRSPRARVADQLIAAIALARTLKLYTTNEADYRGLEGLVDIVPVPRPGG